MSSFVIKIISPPPGYPGGQRELIEIADRTLDFPAFTLLLSGLVVNFFVF